MIKPRLETRDEIKADMNKAIIELEHLGKSQTGIDIFVGAQENEGSDMRTGVNFQVISNMLEFNGTTIPIRVDGNNYNLDTNGALETIDGGIVMSGGSDFFNVCKKIEEAVADKYFDMIFEERAIECDVEPLKNGMYQIDFYNSDSLNGLDETEFTVFDKDNAREELKDLWLAFADENTITAGSIAGIRCVGVDPEIEANHSLDYLER